MGDWGSYSLADLVYVSPAAWARLYERFHAALWPAQIVGVLAGLALLAAAWRRQAWQAALSIAALAWAGVGGVFHPRWHAELNWAAPALGWACVVQALLLAAVAWRGGGWAPAGPARSVGLALIWITVIAGPALPRAEVFGLTPDATTLATLGLLLASRIGAAAVALWPLPLAAAAMALPMALQ